MQSIGRASAKALAASFFNSWDKVAMEVYLRGYNTALETTLINKSLSGFCLKVLVLRKACFMNEQMLSLTWYRFVFFIANACFWQLCLSFEGNKGIIIPLSRITNCWTWGINGALCCHHSLIATAAALCSRLAQVHEKGGCRSLSFMLRVIYRCRNNSRLC